MPVTEGLAVAVPLVGGLLVAADVYTVVDVGSAVLVGDCATTAVPVSSLISSATDSDDDDDDAANVDVGTGDIELVCDSSEEDVTGSTIQ